MTIIGKNTVLNDAEMASTSNKCFGNVVKHLLYSYHGIPM